VNTRGAVRLNGALEVHMAVSDDIRRSVGYASLGFGAVAVLTPRLFLGAYGVPDEQNLRLMTRMWGTRTAALGALTLALRDTEDRRTLMAAAAAMDAADTLLIASSSASVRARAMGAATTAAFAAALAYGLTR
jgi:hypothetical protein